MGKEKKSFVVYFDNLPEIEVLPMEQRGELFTALCKYAENLEYDPHFEELFALNMCFKFMDKSIKRDTEKYQERCEKNKENILKRYSEKTTNKYDCIRPYTNSTDSVSVTAIESDSESVSVCGTTNTNPTQEQVVTFCKEKNYDFDGVDFYNTLCEQDWKTLKGEPIKNWQGYAMVWQRNQKPIVDLDVMF